jgi:folate-dependent phosphoribosylglycinamide formyltransferase PurN
LKVGIVTGTHPHHKYLCTELLKKHEVQLIVHPLPPPRSLRTRLLGRIQETRKKGFWHSALNYAGNRWAVGGWNPVRAYEAAEKEFFPGADREYQRLDRSLIKTTTNINSEASIAQIREVSPDIILCLGGVVYREPFIGSFPRMFNFHAGISPIYNGASTINRAFANGHLQFCGGTLMVLSAAIDGGEILAHYLPEIREGDNPATIFMRTIIGAVKLYDRLLTDLEKGREFCVVPQGRPLFYCRSAEWTVQHNRAVKRLLDKGAAGRFSRGESYLPYWSAGSPVAARQLFHETLLNLLDCR